MRKLLIKTSILGLLFTGFVQAQQDPQYTQYMYNQNVINPAYAGTLEGLRAVALYRQQWSGVEGAPETITGSLSTPLGDRTGLGLSFIGDQIGPVNEKNAYIDFSYRFPVGERTTLALGVKAGATFFDVDLGSVATTVPGDPLFSEQLQETYFNVGTGAFLYGDKWYIGASVPQIIDAVHLDEDGRNYGNETQHGFLTTGYVFDLSENVKFKPNALVKAAFDSPISFDVNTNFLFYERVELGVSYRYEDSFSGLVGFNITDQLRVGYAYDRVISDISVVTDSSHEAFVSFDISFPDRVMQSPRFF